MNGHLVALKEKTRGYGAPLEALSGAGVDAGKVLGRWQVDWPGTLAANQNKEARDSLEDLKLDFQTFILNFQKNGKLLFMAAETKGGVASTVSEGSFQVAGQVLTITTKSVETQKDLTVKEPYSLEEGSLTVILKYGEDVLATFVMKKMK